MLWRLRTCPTLWGREQLLGRYSDLFVGAAQGKPHEPQ